MMTMTMVLSGWELGLPNSVRGLPQMTIFLSQNFPYWPFHFFSHFPLNNLRVSFFFTKCFFLHDFHFGLGGPGHCGDHRYLKPRSEQPVPMCQLCACGALTSAYLFDTLVTGKVRAAECSFVSKQIWRCFLRGSGEACTL